MTDIPASLADLDAPEPALPPDSDDGSEQAALIERLGGRAEFRVPDGYVIRRTGIFRGDRRVTLAPVIPLRILIDPARNQLVELAWLDGRSVVRATVARGDLSSGRRLVNQLGDKGLPVTDADSKGAERFLADVLFANHRVIPRVPLVRWLGWQPDGSFVASADQEHHIEPQYEDQVKAAEAHHRSGSMEGWQRAVKPLADYPAAQVGLYAGLAAPLLQLLGLDSFTVDISGRSTRGKTTAAMTGFSAWGDPDDKGEGMYHWRTTMISAEKRLNLVRGIPVVFDETRVVKDPKLVDDLLYQVPKNHGTPRSGGWPSMLPWSTILVSTGEQAALSFTTHEGASARVLSVRQPPFGNDGADSAAAAVEVGNGVRENFGHAGPVFVGRLRELLADDGGRDRLRERHARLASLVQGETDMTRRRAPMVACLMLAAGLAAEFGIVPFDGPAPEDWRSLIAEAEDLRDDRPGEALDVVREHIASHNRAMWAPGDGSDKQPNGGWIGRWLEIDGQRTAALLPERLKRVLADAGYTLDAVRPGWIESGALVLGPASQRPRYLVARKLAGTKPKMYVFTPGVIKDDTEPDD